MGYNFKLIYNDTAGTKIDRTPKEPQEHEQDYPVSHQRTFRTAFLEAVKYARIRVIKLIFEN